MLGGQLVEGNMLCNSFTSKSVVSINTDAGPSAPDRSPSSTLTAKVKRVSRELRYLKNDDCVVNQCITLVKDRDSSVRWVLGETLAFVAENFPFTPVLQLLVDWNRPKPMKPISFCRDVPLRLR